MLKKEIVLIFVLSAFSTIGFTKDSPAAPTASPIAMSVAAKKVEQQPIFDHADWSRLLSEHVIAVGNSTQFDYAGIERKATILQHYLDKLSAVTRANFDSWPKDEQLAFLLNAYNAWTVKLVLSNYKNIKSIKELGSLMQSPWKKPFIPLLGKTLSLDDIEHGLIRGSGRYLEPRIHFAANCASIGCPAIRNEAYISTKLESQLEDQTHKFLEDRTRNYLANDVLQLSSIFKWYRDDFENGWRGTESLEQFIALYATDLSLSPQQIENLKNGKMRIEFLDYNWNLNRTYP